MAKTVRHPNSAGTMFARKRKASRQTRTRQNRHAVKQYIRTHRDDEGYQDKPMYVCEWGCCF